jgi:hypothetical protein
MKQNHLTTYAKSPCAKTITFQRLPWKRTATLDTALSNKTTKAKHFEDSGSIKQISYEQFFQVSKSSNFKI